MSTGVQQPPMFLTLSELDQHRMTLKDWLTLLPAVVLSFLLNGVLMFLLVVSSNNQARAENRLRDTQGDDATQVADDKKKNDENPTIDINTPEFDAPKDIIQSERLSLPALDPPPDEKPTGLTEPPPEKEPIGGAGPGSDAKIRGADGLGAEGLRGNPIFRDIGAVGSSGSLPIGGGAGILTGGGGGSSKSGGFGHRTGDLSGLAKMLGGSDESERAVARALMWLRNHQGPDGRWSLDKYHTYDNRCNCQSPIEKEIEPKSKMRFMRTDDVSGTALGVLPFLAAGHHHLSQKEEGRTVAQALRYLMSRQNGNGSFLDGPADMYTHGLATIALCEAYGMTNDPKLREAATRAINFIVRAQDTARGGWRYQPNTTSDTSVVGWQVMALKSAQIAGLSVPASTLENASRWLDLAEYKKKQPDGKTFVMYAYSYDQNEPNAPGGPATTAAGLLNRLYLGWGPRNANMIGGCDYLMATALPPSDTKPGHFKNIYTWYYAAQVMHHMGGEYWQQWNPKMREYLIKTQEREGHKAGSWDPTGDAWGRHGGRLYTTSLSVLTLEVYYRHLPLYRREKVDEELSKRAAMDQKK